MNDKKKILIVLADYYKDISELLFYGAVAELKKKFYEYDIIRVAGALEIAIAISMKLDKDKYAGYVGLGCVIRGETYHFDIVANESSRALMDLGVQEKVAIGNGILTVENFAQAYERADQGQLNKGAGAVAACISLIELNS